MVRVETLLTRNVRSLELWNFSKGYVAFRVTGDDGASFVTPALPPGGESNTNLSESPLGLCPETVRIEIFAYRRANPDASPLDDETLEPAPYASTEVVLYRERHFGCRADDQVITLFGTIFCDVMAVDRDAGRISYQAGSASAMFELVARVDSDRGRPEPPEPAFAEGFPLVGRVIDLEGRGIPDAEITLTDYALTLATDANGRFEFDRPPGNYGLSIAAEGYSVTPAGIRVVHRSPRSGPVVFVATPE